MKIGTISIPSQESFECYIRNLHLVDAVPRIVGIKPLILLDLFDRLQAAQALDDSIAYPSLNLADKRIATPLSIALHRYWQRTRSQFAELRSLKPAKSGPLISVIITTRNRSQYLNWTLESLRRQSYLNFEVLIADDASSRTERAKNLGVVKKFRKWLRIRYYENATCLGPSANRNALATAAKGQYLVFMDDDNWAYPHQLGAFVSAQKKTNADAVSCWCDYYKSRKNLSRPDLKPLLRWAPSGSPLSTNVFINELGDTNSLIRKSAFLKIGGFENQLKIVPEDHDLFFRLKLAGYKHIVQPSVLFKYRHLRSGRFFKILKARKADRIYRHFFDLIKHRPQIVAAAKTFREESVAAAPTEKNAQGDSEFSKFILKASAQSSPVVWRGRPQIARIGKGTAGANYILRKEFIKKPGRYLVSIQGHFDYETVITLKYKSGDAVKNHQRRRVVAPGWSTALFEINIAKPVRDFKFNLNRKGHFIQDLRLIQLGRIQTADSYPAP